MHYQQVLKALGFKEFQVPLHLALMDASGDAALIEYTAKGVSGGPGGRRVLSAVETAMRPHHAHSQACQQLGSGMGQAWLVSHTGGLVGLHASAPFRDGHSAGSHPPFSSPHMQAEVYWGATVVANDPIYPEHQHWYKSWIQEAE